MKPGTRAAVAFIAGRLIGSGSGGAIYDYSAHGYRILSGIIGPNVQVYDHTDKCHITGTPSNLYHHGQSNYISINLDGKSFSGYDYASTKYFSGKVNGSNISMYDYDGGQHFHYVMR